MAQGPARLGKGCSERRGGGGRPEDGVGAPLHLHPLLAPSVGHTHRGHLVRPSIRGK